MEDDNGYSQMEAPPDEEETGGSVYFDPADAPTVKKPQPKPEPAPAPTVKPRVATGDAKATFGTFLRYLRKTGKSGVVFAICMDLDYAYEDGVFTLYTDSDTIYRSLSKPEHYGLIRDSFAGIGIDESGFAVKLRGKAGNTVNDDVETIKETFRGTKMDIK